MSLNNAAKLRVAGGVAKGRRLESPDVFLRPMMGKVRIRGSMEDARRFQASRRCVVKVCPQRRPGSS